MSIYLCILDFEATCWDDNSKKPKEVTEFPSVLLKWNSDGKTERVSEIQMFCKPKLDPKLSKFCTELTGITQAQVDVGIPFFSALAKHHSWLKQNVEDLDEVIIVTCGAWDLEKCLPTQCRIWNKNVNNLPDVYNHFVNIKDVYQQFYNKKAKSMVSMLNDLGLTLDGRHHSGIDDCKNITKIFETMIKDGFTDIYSVVRYF